MATKTNSKPCEISGKKVFQQLVASYRDELEILQPFKMGLAKMVKKLQTVNCFRKKLHL